MNFIKKYPFIVGERVKSVYGDWYTEIIEMKEIDGEIKYRITNSGIYYFQSANNFIKCEQEPFSKEEIDNTIKILNHFKNQYNKENNQLSANSYNNIIMDIKRQYKKYHESK